MLYKFRFVVPFCVGVVSAPFLKPLVRVAAKATVKAALQAKKLAAEAAEELQDVVAEATAENQMPSGSSKPANGSGVSSPAARAKA